MENLFQEGCHRILDLHTVNIAVGAVESFHESTDSVSNLKQEVYEIPMFVINGDAELSNEISIYSVTFSEY